MTDITQAMIDSIAAKDQAYFESIAKNYGLPKSEWQQARDMKLAQMQSDMYKQQNRVTLQKVYGDGSDGGPIITGQRSIEPQRLTDFNKALLEGMTKYGTGTNTYSNQYGEFTPAEKGGINPATGLPEWTGDQFHGVDESGNPLDWQSDYFNKVQTNEFGQNYLPGSATSWDNFNLWGAGPGGGNVVTDPEMREPNPNGPGSTPNTPYNPTVPTNPGGGNIPGGGGPIPSAGGNPTLPGIFNQPTGGSGSQVPGGMFGQVPGVPMNPIRTQNPNFFSPYGEPVSRMSDQRTFGGLPRSTGPWGIMGGYYGGNPYTEMPEGYQPASPPSLPGLPGSGASQYPFTPIGQNPYPSAGAPWSSATGGGSTPTTPTGPTGPAPGTPGNPINGTVTPGQNGDYLTTGPDKPGSATTPITATVGGSADVGGGNNKGRYRVKAGNLTDAQMNQILQAAYLNGTITQ